MIARKHGSNLEREPERSSENAEGRTAFADMVLVGRITRPHGLRGQVAVSPETDFAEARFAVGAVLWTRSGAGEQPLTIASARMHGNRAIVGFAGVERIEDAESLAGQELRVPEEALQPLTPGTYYEHQLAGCEVVTTGGERVGPVRRVEGGAGSSRLVIDGAHGEVQVPLASDICREVDVIARRIVIEPPEGLLELNEVRRRHDLPADGDRGARGRGRQPGN
jgi:16S rRNA processing protein RimM